MNRRPGRVSAASRWVAAAVAIAAAAGAVVACRDNAETGPSPGDDWASPARFLASVDDAGFARLERPWTFRFPADHGPHHRYRTEWWHLTGVLAGNDARRLGVQLSVVRIGLTPRRPDRASRWAATDVYTGVLSLSGAGLEQPYTYQRISRGALGLAGARSRPVQVWVESWRLEQTGGGDRLPDLKLHATAPDLELDLELSSTQPMIESNDINGQDAQQAPPFVFYIQPRLSARGSVSIEGRRASVSGPLSMEHAWGELPLPGGPVARDRFTLYLDDGRELFCIHTHRVDGSGSPSATCLLVGRDGKALLLSDRDIDLSPLDFREHEGADARYPTRWALRIPGHDIDMEIVYPKGVEGGRWTPFQAGPVRLEPASDEPGGYGFVQLNGYHDS